MKKEESESAGISSEYPTDPPQILEPKNWDFSQSFEVHKCRATDVEAS